MCKMLLSVFACLVLISSAKAQDAQPIPPDAAKLVNPVKPTPESQARVKKMWGYECSMCHGNNGDGKGDVVAAMKLTMKDYTDPAALKDISDGEMFYIIKNGKGQMPGEGERAKPDEVWNMVIYIRSMAKK
jgi:mono/diheme cytochrome c family protein